MDRDGIKKTGKRKLAPKQAPDPERKRSLRSASGKNDLSATPSSSKSEDRFAVQQPVNTSSSSGQTSSSDDDNDGGVPLGKRLKSGEMGDGIKSVGAAHMEGQNKSVGDADLEDQEMSAGHTDLEGEEEAAGDTKMEGEEESVGGADVKGKEEFVTGPYMKGEEESLAGARLIKEEQGDAKADLDKYEDPTAAFDIKIKETPPTVIPTVATDEESLEIPKELKDFSGQWFNRIMEAAIVDDKVCLPTVGRFLEFLQKGKLPTKLACKVCQCHKSDNPELEEFRKYFRKMLEDEAEEYQPPPPVNPFTPVTRR